MELVGRGPDQASGCESHDPLKSFLIGWPDLGIDQPRRFANCGDADVVVRCKLPVAPSARRIRRRAIAYDCCQRTLTRIIRVDSLAQARLLEGGIWKEDGCILQADAVQPLSSGARLGDRSVPPRAGSSRRSGLKRNAGDAVAAEDCLYRWMP